MTSVITTIARSGAGASARSPHLEESLNTDYHELFFRESTRETLRDFLHRNLQHIEINSWDRRAWLGGIYVNGRKFGLDSTLPNPCRIEYFEPKYDIYHPEQAFPRFDESWILHKDEDLLAVFKPAGLPTLPTREQQHFCLKNYLQAYLGYSPHLPSRLDSATSGVVPVSTSKRMHSRLQRLFERRLVKKTYRFLSRSKPEVSAGVVDLPIGKDPEHPILRRIDEAGGQHARTAFRVLSTTEQGTLVEAQPITGRTHQIRLHALALGCPILGDPFYALDADSDSDEAELRLACVELRLYHPFLRSPLSLQASPDLLPSWACSS